MARILPFNRPRGAGDIKTGDVRAMVWTGLLAGLLWINFEGGTAPVRPAAAGPASLNPSTGPVTIRSAVRIVDGDTFWVGGDKIRIADIDTPETHPARCAQEAELGEKATRRLAVLLGEGPFELERVGGRDVDRYGRKLRIVTRNGRSLGDVLVAEGLARTWTGRREPWCFS
jgi:endonuclease YncB( thermonuclease family)